MYKAHRKLNGNESSITDTNKKNPAQRIAAVGANATVSKDFTKKREITVSAPKTMKNRVPGKIPPTHTSYEAKQVKSVVAAERRTIEKTFARNTKKTLATDAAVHGKINTIAGYSNTSKATVKTSSTAGKSAAKKLPKQGQNLRQEQVSQENSADMPSIQAQVTVTEQQTSNDSSNVDVLAPKANIGEASVKLTNQQDSDTYDFYCSDEGSPRPLTLPMKILKPRSINTHKEVVTQEAKVINSQTTNIKSKTQQLDQNTRQQTTTKEFEIKISDLENTNFDAEAEYNDTSSHDSDEVLVFRKTPQERKEYKLSANRECLRHMHDILLKEGDKPNYTIGKDL